MPHLDISVDSKHVDLDEIAKTMGSAVSIIAEHFETNSEYVAAGTTDVLDIQVLSRRNTKAASRFLREALQAFWRTTRHYHR